MRFALLHKLTSYLLIAAGFAALALSGELPPLLTLGTLVLGALSFFFEPARFSFLRSSWWSGLCTVLTLALIAILCGGALRSETVLVAGVRSLCILLLNKLWNRRASRDWLQAYVLSFLMLIAGTTLNTELVFALCFLVYVVAATWTLTLFHLRREMEDNYLLKHEGGGSERVGIERVLNSRRVVGGTFLAGTSTISAGVFVVSAVFFFLFPRVGFNVFSSHMRRGMQVGFSDKGVELGGNGLIKDNEQVVMRVEFPESGPPRVPLYFRGISFDRYRNGRWSPSPSGDQLRLRATFKRWGSISLIGIARSTPVDGHHATLMDSERVKRHMDRSLHQAVYLEPMDASVLFAAEMPRAVAIPQSRPGGPIQPVAEGEFLDRTGRFSTGDIFATGRQGGIKYDVWSQIAPPSESESEADLRAAAPTAADLDTLSPYLDVEGVPEEVLELGRKLTRNERTPWGKAQAVLRYLRGNYKYTIDLAHDPDKEPLAEFLFERKKGHCEYFASAMAILLRAAGVPTRHVAGFYGGDWNDIGHYLQVRQRDAHAWVEAYVGGDAGWVTLDPTPPGIGAGATASSRLKQMMDVIELAWFKYVIEYDLTTQLDLLSRFRPWGSDWSKDEKDPKKASSPFGWKRLKRPAIAGGVVIAGLLLLRLRRRRTRPTTRIESALQRAMKALASRGLARDPSETPRALAVRAIAMGDPGAEAFDALVDLYYQARFGRREVDAERLEALALTVVRARATATVEDDRAAA